MFQAELGQSTSATRLTEVVQPHCPAACLIIIHIIAKRVRRGGRTIRVELGYYDI